MKKKNLIHAKQYAVITDWMKPRRLTSLVIEYPSNYPGLRTCKTIIALYEPDALTAPCLEMDYIASPEIIEKKLKFLATKLKSNPINGQEK